MVQVNTFSSGNHMSRLVVLIAISLINVHKSIPKGRHFKKKPFFCLKCIIVKSYQSDLHALAS